MDRLNRRKFLGAAAVGIPALVASGARAQSPPGYVPNNWYPPTSAPVTSGAALTVGRLYLRPVFIAQALTVHALAAKVSTASAGGNFQLALYTNNSGVSPAINRPGTLVDHTGNISTRTIGEFSALLGANRSLKAGYYWTGHQCDNTVASTSERN